MQKFGSLKGSNLNTKLNHDKSGERENMFKVREIIKWCQSQHYKNQKDEVKRGRA